MAISFDGPNTTITLDSGVTSVTVQEVYSRWKDWVAASDNAKYLPAFRVIGGDPLGGGISAGAYFFLRNDNGWKIKPPEEDISIDLEGNLYPQDALGSAVIAGTTGNYNSDIRLTTSSLTQVVSTGSGLSASEQTKLQEIWQRLGLDSNNSTTNRTDGGYTSGTITVTGSTDGNGHVTQSRQ